MAHQIRSNDHLALADKGAWHGMGTVVKGAMNPFSALKIAGMEWEVLESDSLSGVYGAGEKNEFRVSTDSGKLLVRSDDHSVLGIVGPDYQPFQNQAMAELAYALRSNADGTTEVETAGSIFGGRKVWMMLRAASVQFGGKDDESVPYLFLANSHDGSMALKAMPTAVRVVCSNTFHMALSSAKRGISFKHTLNLSNRVEELKRTIHLWQESIDKSSKTSRQMASKPMTRAQVQDLWVEVVQRLDGEIPQGKDLNGWEQNRRERALNGLAHMAKTFDLESQQFGANLWVAANAATNWVQHIRAQDSVRTKDNSVRQFAAWGGTVADDVAEVFETALERV